MLNNEQNLSPETPQQAPAQQPFAQQQGYPYATYPPQKPPRPPMQKFPIFKKDFIMVLCAILWTYLAFLLTLENGMALGFMLSYLSGFILFSLYFFQKGKTVLKPFETICGAIAVCSAPAYAFTGNEVKVLLFLVSFFCAIVWFGSLCGKQEGATDAALIPYVFKELFGNMFGAIARSMASLFGGNGEKQRRAWLWKALIGLAVSLPIAGILLLLLTSADQAFNELVNRIVQNLGEQILRIFLALLISPFVISYALGLKKKTQDLPKEERKGGIDFPYVTAFLGFVSLIYLLYLFSQLAYFFNGFAGILPKGVLPADYARRGFFELCAIAAINFVMIFLVLLFTKKKETKLPVPVKWESAFICLFTLVLVATAASKMVLYIRLFGLTQARVYTSAFMLFMAIVFIALLTRLFRRKVRVLRVAVVTAACILLILSFGRVDYVISRYNVWAYQTERLSSLDIHTIRYNGDAGIEVLSEIYQSNDPKLLKYHDDVKQILTDQASTRFYRNRSGEVRPWEERRWTQWVYEESKADNILRTYFE